MATSQVELNDQLQNGTSGTLINKTVTTMHLTKSHSWSGRFNGAAPQIIAGNGGVSRFTHFKGDQGSKAALIYTCPTTVGVPSAVILAWSAPANIDHFTSTNKVFGVYGPKDDIDAMSWDEIEMKLDKAGSSIVIEDGFCIHATILNNPITKMADLLANFSLCPKP